MNTSDKKPMRHTWLFFLLAAALLLSQLQVTTTPLLAAASETTAASKKPVDVEKVVETIQAKIEKHWPHMNKVWPTYDYNNHNLILFYVTDDDAPPSVWRLSVDGRRELLASEYESMYVPQPGGYEQLDFEGKPSIAMSFDDSVITEDDVVDALYRVATHELVHFYYQSEQTSNESGGSRSQEFPVDKTPRLYRRMLYENLIRAYDHPEKKDEYLGKARYWLDHWQKEYSAEATAIHSTDRNEAPARYTDNLASFITSEMTDDDIYREAGNYIARDEMFYSADAESYEIGNVAALLLDQQAPGWKDTYYQEKQTIEEKLLEGVAPLADEIDPAVETKLTEALDAYNENTKKEIADIISAEADKDIAYLKLDISALTSSMAAAGMLTYEEKEIIVKYANKFSVDGKTVAIDGANVIDAYTDDGRSYLYVPLPDNITWSDDHLSVDTATLKVDEIKATSTKEDGRTVYEATVDGGAEGGPQSLLPEDTAPADDFYQAVNARLINEKRQTPDGEYWDQFAELENKVQDQLLELFDELNAGRETFEAGSTEHAVAGLLQLALDKDGREAAAFGALKPYLDNLKNAASIDDYLDAVAVIRKDLGKSSLFTLAPSPNPTNAKTYALFLTDPAGLVKHTLLDIPEVASELEGYTATLLKENGMTEADARDWSGRLLTFFKKIAASAQSEQEASDPSRLNHVLTSEQLQEKMPNAKVNRFLENSGLNEFTSFVAVNPAMLDLINESLQPENLELLKQYSTVTLLNDYALYLNLSLGQAHARFNQQDDSPESLAVSALQTIAEPEVGELYAKKTCTPEKKEHATQLVNDILAAYRSHLEKLDWLSEAGRTKALAKIDNMRLKVAFPDTYTSVVKAVDAADDKAAVFIDRIITIDKERAKIEREKATASVDHTKWPIPPQLLNAYYDPAINSIVLPAAMLQAPFYEETASKAENLGGIGAIIAHEMTHAFDDAGSLYDENGNIRDWWSEADRARFNERAKQFVEYFSSFEAAPGQNLNGELTLGENIADTGGISIVSSLVSDDKAALQTLFKKYAEIWASAAGEEAVAEQIMYDEHAPAKLRVNAVLSTTDRFYEAFDIKPGDGMYIDPAKRVNMY